MKTSPAMEKLAAGLPLETAEEWADLGDFVSAASTFLGLVNEELNAVDISLDIIEKLMVVLADFVDPATRTLMTEVAASVYKQSKGLSVPDLQGEDDRSGNTGPDEPDEGGVMSPEGTPV